MLKKFESYNWKKGKFEKKGLKSKMFYLDFFPARRSRSPDTFSVQTSNTEFGDPDRNGRAKKLRQQVSIATGKLMIISKSWTVFSSFVWKNSLAFWYFYHHNCDLWLQMIGNDSRRKSVAQRSRDFFSTRWGKLGHFFIRKSYFFKFETV